MKFEYEGQNVDFYIPDGHKHIGVTLSGGTDSSLILYMLCKEIQRTKRTDIEIICITVSMYNRLEESIACDIIDYMRAEFGDDMFLRNHIIYHPTHEDKTFAGHEVEHYLMDNGELDLLMFGTTIDVPNQILEKADGSTISFGDMIVAGYRDGRDQKQNLYLPATGRSCACYSPFRNCDKRMVAHIYKELDLNKLLKLTRSCSDNFDWKDAITSEDVCKECLPCLEKYWGFGEF